MVKKELDEKTKQDDIWVDYTNISHNISKEIETMTPQEVDDKIEENTASISQNTSDISSIESDISSIQLDISTINAEIVSIKSRLNALENPKGGK